MKFPALTSIIALVMFASCGHQLTPKEVVENIYNDMKEKNYSDLTEYIYTDTLAPLSKSEVELFTNIMTDLYKETPEYNNIEILGCGDGQKSDTARYTVKTVFANGENYTEKGTLIKNSEGQWKIRLFSSEEEILADTTTSEIEDKRTYKVYDNMQFAITKLYAIREIPRFLYYMGGYYNGGLYVKKDSLLAHKYYMQAAEKGNAFGLAAVGWEFLNGYATSINYEKAFQYMKKSAEKGFAQAQYELGRMYLNGTGTPVNTKEAVVWFQKAADKSVPDAFQDLGYCYSQGLGVKKDIQKADELFRKAAQKGVVVAIYNVGIDCENKKNYKEAYRWYLQAAQKEYSNAQFKVGVFNFYGNGVKKDTREAYYWFKKAADQGHIDAIKTVKWMETHRY